MKNTLSALLLLGLFGSLFFFSSCREHSDRSRMGLKGKVKQIETVLDGSETYLSEFDKDGHLTRYISFAEDTTITDFDKNGLPFKITIKGAGLYTAIPEMIRPDTQKYFIGKDSTGYIICSYNEQREITQRISYINNQKVLEENFSYENGILTSQEHINEFGEKTQTLYVYNKEGLLIEEHLPDGSKLSTYTYTEFDSQNNWVKREYQIDGTSYLDARNITYWN